MEPRNNPATAATRQRQPNEHGHDEREGPRTRGAHNPELSSVPPHAKPGNAVGEPAAHGGAALRTKDRF